LNVLSLSLTGKIYFQILQEVAKSPCVCVCVKDCRDIGKDLKFFALGNRLNHELP